MAAPFAFLTREWLRQHTIPQTLERGEAYYQKGRILSVVQRGEIIEGQVQGSRKYVQTIGLTEDGEPVATCNCPYNSSGYCKHIAAVAMAAIDGHVEQAGSSQKNTAVTGADTEFYRNTFLESREGAREAFLMQAFARKPEWREAFEQFLSSPPPQHLVDIREVRERIRDTLLEMEISPQEVEMHTGKHGQRSEVAESFLRTKLFQLFRTHQNHLKRRLKMGDLLNAHRIWLASYEAVSGIESLPHCDIVLPDELSSYLRWEWSQTNVMLLTAVAGEILGPALVRQLVTLFSDRWSFYASGADTRKPPIHIDEKDFEPWLILMAADPISATFVKHRKEAFGWQLPRLDEAIAKLL